MTVRLSMEAKFVTEIFLVASYRVEQETVAIQRTSIAIILRVRTGWRLVSE